MSDLSNRLALRERMLYEENVRLNRDHATLLRLAPDAWEQFKTAFFDERDAINAEPILTRLECVEPDKQTLDVNRISPYMPPVGALTFRFDPAAPCIVWHDLRNNKPAKRIEMKSDGETVHFVQDGKALILSRFAAACIGAILQ